MLTLQMRECLQMKNDPRSCDRNFYNCVKKPEKISGLQRGICIIQENVSKHSVIKDEKCAGN